MAGQRLIPVLGTAAGDHDHGRMRPRPLGQSEGPGEFDPLVEVDHLLLLVGERGQGLLRSHQAGGHLPLRQASELEGESAARLGEVAGEGLPFEAAHEGRVARNAGDGKSDPLGAHFADLERQVLKGLQRNVDMADQGPLLFAESDDHGEVDHARAEEAFPLAQVGGLGGRTGRRSHRPLAKSGEFKGQLLTSLYEGAFQAITTEETVEGGIARYPIDGKADPGPLDDHVAKRQLHRPLDGNVDAPSPGVGVRLEDDDDPEVDHARADGALPAPRRVGLSGREGGEPRQGQDRDSVLEGSAVAGHEATLPPLPGPREPGASLPSADRNTIGPRCPSTSSTSPWGSPLTTW